jgi:hypothetical protein
MEDTPCLNGSGPRVPNHCGKALQGKVMPRYSDENGMQTLQGYKSSGSLCHLISCTRGEFDAFFPLRGYLLGKGGSNVKRICDTTGARVSIQTFKDANPQDDAVDPKDVLLQLRIIGGRGADLQKAAEMVKKLVANAKEDHDKRKEEKQNLLSTKRSWETMHQRPKLHQQVVLVLDGNVRPDFPLRSSVLGRGGEHIRYICEQTEARIQLEGKPLQLKVVAKNKEAMDEAMDMVSDLLKQVRNDHDSWVERRRRLPEKESIDKHPRCGNLVAQQDKQQEVPAMQSFPELESKQHTCSQQVHMLQKASRDARLAARAACEGSQQSRSAQAAAAHRNSVASPSKIARHLDACASRRRAPVDKGSGADRMGGFCALFPMGVCPFKDRSCCPRGRHGEPQLPAQSEVLLRITKAKKRLLQQKWVDAGGHVELVNAWQVRNPRTEFFFRASECDFAEALGHSSDVIDGWHGTHEENVLSIAVHGFDPSRRCGQAYGAGEYFAKDPNVSVGYARGGAFMFLCKLLLGKADQDHTWVDSCQYYVLKQRDCRVQALPLFVVQFQSSEGQLCIQLNAIKSCDSDVAGALAARQRGGLQPCEARRDAGMSADLTRHLWVGWLDPRLCCQDDDAITEDVEAFLVGHCVAEVIPERNGARIGAFVLLAKGISRTEFESLRRRLYHGEFRISVDDQQPGNPKCKGKLCPRLTGPSHYCRGWNLKGHHAWQWGCPFDHPGDQRPTHGAEYTLERVSNSTAKYDEIETELLSSAPFTSADGTCGNPRIVAVHRIINKPLQRLYEERRGFLHDKHGFAVEKELWHGTNCKALPELMTHGLQPPADTKPSDECPHSGKKDLCTTLCGTDCRHCREAHAWDRCHMYGLGVYLADLAQKSHRYVREPGFACCTAGRRDHSWQTVLAGRWRDFDDATQDVLETAHKAGKRVHSFVARGFRYEFNFERMVQINVNTGRERPARRIEISASETDEDSGSLDLCGAFGGCSGSSPRVYSMLRCRVCLGNPFLIEGNLMRSDAMHNMVWCQDPTDALDSSAESWNIAKGHDAFYVRGLAGAQ